MKRRGYDVGCTGKDVTQRSRSADAEGAEKANTGAGIKASATFKSEEKTGSLLAQEGDYEVVDAGA